MTNRLLDHLNVSIQPAPSVWTDAIDRRDLRWVGSYKQSSPTFSQSSMDLTRSHCDCQIVSLLPAFGAHLQAKAITSHFFHVQPDHYPQKPVCPGALPTIQLLLMLNPLIFLNSLIRLGFGKPLSLWRRLSSNPKGITGPNVWKLQFNFSFRSW